jgi:glyoxylase-like metal-dependent hydrolase (beta-lactamase superfamily II)
MTEPREIATDVAEVAPGVWHWQIANSAIGGGTSSCHLLAVDGESVLIDPLRLEPAVMAGLPEPTAIVLTAKCHQRSAWRYRTEFGIDVWAPQGAPEADEEPDHRYGEGDELPGGLHAVLTPGPEPVHYCLLRAESPRVLFCSDLLMGDADGRIAFVPGEYHDDPAGTRRSVERLLGLPFDVLCLDHGTAVSDDPRGAIRTLLAA